jgi:predicted membrane chloride channel (bestrophin family)
MIKQLKNILSIVNYQTIIVTLLALLSTWLCVRYGLTANFPLTVVATAIIFPIVFSIGGAYKRREDALKQYGSLKAHARALFFASRDWVESDEKLQKEIGTLLKRFFINCRELFKHPVAKMHAREKVVYRTFSELSLFIKGLRKRGLQGGEVSRGNQYLSKMLVAFENIKHIYQYRTPVTLRTYSKVFIVLIPILYGPYFAHIAAEFSSQLTYLVPALFSIVLVSLDNIQDHLENPFDQVGEDDIHFNAEKFHENLF